MNETVARSGHTAASGSSCSRSSSRSPSSAWACASPATTTRPSSSPSSCAPAARGPGRSRRIAGTSRRSIRASPAPGQDDPGARRLPLRRRGVRPQVLQHLAEGSGVRRSAAPAAARMRVEGAGVGEHRPGRARATATAACTSASASSTSASWSRSRSGRPRGQHGPGTAHSAACGRLSYFLGWRGPCICVDTACSASLVALHLAVQGLRRGECSIALCGGVNVIAHPRNHIIFSQANMLSPDGRCKTFDERADGYARSEGCGVLVLKRLSTRSATATASSRLSAAPRSPGRRERRAHRAQRHRPGGA